MKSKMKMLKNILKILKKKQNEKKIFIKKKKIII